MSQVKHNPDQRRFELTLNGRLAVLEYQQAGKRIAFTHTEVPIELRGRGLGGQLAKAALDYASPRRIISL
jgi:uncharacterized protein